VADTTEKSQVLGGQWPELHFTVSERVYHGQMKIKSE
jgi:hypothetical protein